jgi:hypothetical protein
MSEDMRQQITQAAQNAFREGERPVNVNLPVNLKATGPDGTGEPEIKFPKFKPSAISDFTDDFISDATAYLQRPSIKKRWQKFWNEDFIPKLESVKGKNLVSELVQGIMSGDIRQTDLKGMPDKYRKAVQAGVKAAAAKVPDSSTKGAVSQALRDVLPDVVKAQVGLDVRWRLLRSSLQTPATQGGGSGGIGQDSLPVGAGGVVVNISTGVGDPVAIGREVSRVLGAYSARAGHI